MPQGCAAYMSLHDACEEGDTALARRLIDEGADVNATDLVWFVRLTLQSEKE